jgi:23S rRNA maturation-related 3'-5' exoribonuclease YhaM
MCKFINLTLRELDENSEAISGTQIKGYYKVISTEVKTTKGDDKYIKWLLTDGSGIKKVLRTNWTYDEKLLIYSQGKIIQIVGTINIHQGMKQLVLDCNPGTGAYFIRVASKHEIQGISFIPEENNSLSKVEIFNYVADIEDESIRKLLQSILGKETNIFEIPATKNFHHVSLGGLAKYILDVIKISLALAENEEHEYEIDKDFLIAGSILSNIGKAYAVNPENQDYTFEYRALGTNGLSIKVLYQHLNVVPNIDSKKLLLLENIILSKNTEEREGIVKAISIEGNILHRASQAVATINSICSLVNKDGTIGEMTSFSKVHEQYFYKGGR